MSILLPLLWRLMRSWHHSSVCILNLNLSSLFHYRCRMVASIRGSSAVRGAAISTFPWIRPAQPLLYLALPALPLLCLALPGSTSALPLLYLALPLLRLALPVLYLPLPGNALGAFMGSIFLLLPGKYNWLSFHEDGTDVGAEKAVRRTMSLSQGPLIVLSVYVVMSVLYNVLHRSCLIPRPHPKSCGAWEGGYCIDQLL